MRNRLAAVVAAVAAVGMLASFVAPAGAAVGPRQILKASLTGKAEVPGPGDPNGAGRAVIVAKTKARKVCFALRWSRLGPVVAAHIHEGRAGVAGAPVVTLFEAAGGISKNVNGITGCVRGVERSLIRNIKRHPKRYYVNIHTKGYPDGAIRGQLKQ